MATAAEPAGLIPDRLGPFSETIVDGFLLLVGHLAGDFILQEDWQARHKANLHPGPNPSEVYAERLAARGPGVVVDKTESDRERQAFIAWLDARREWALGNLACTVHVTLYTLAIWLASYTWMPLWGLAVVWATHWPIDRYRLARRWMTGLAHQRHFATGPLAPWSVIVVDQVLHLVVLAVLAALTYPTRP